MARKQTVAGYSLLLPSLLGIVAFLLIPIGVVVWLSTQRWDLLSPARFVGAQNFGDVFTDAGFWQSIAITALFVLIVIPLQTALGLLLASLLSRGLPGSGLFRVLYVIPWVCAPLALGIVWRWIFAPTGGALNAILGTNMAWLSDPFWAFVCVVAVSVWSQVGYVALFFTAGLANIPPELIDAAKVDGANARQAFWRIKLPLLRPTMFFVLATGFISSFQAFDTVYGLTPDGGPNGSTKVVALEIYSRAFENFDLGRASVMALTVFVILVVATVAQQLYFRKRSVYEY